MRMPQPPQRRATTRVRNAAPRSAEPSPPPVRIVTITRESIGFDSLERELREAGTDFSVQRAASAAELRPLLTTFDPDVVVCEDAVPGLPGLSAIQVVGEVARGIPVILVTTSHDDETAVAYMKAGAADCVHRERTARLTAAVMAALKQHREHEEKELAVAARLETEERLSIVVLATNDAVWDWSPPDRTVWVNDRFRRMFGYRPEQVSGDLEWWLDRVHPEDQGRIAREFRAFLTGKADPFSEEYRFRRADGTFASVLNRARAIRDDRGRAIRVIGAIMDMSRLLHAEKRYRSIFDAAPFGIYQTSIDNRIITANPTLAAILGYDSSDDLLGMSLLETVFAKPETVTQTLGKGWMGRLHDLETQCHCKDGSLSWVRVTTRPAVDGTGHIQGFVRDISQEKQLEEQLRQAQKIEAVGQLAGGVAHDFNNILTAIIVSAQLLEAELSPDSPELTDVKEIRSAADRAASLTRQLLAFSRRQVMEFTILDINAVVANVEKMLRRLIGENIHLRTALADDLHAVLADAGQLEQVLLNLVVNARDAMPEGGTITVETANVELDQAYAAGQLGVAPGHYVMLAVHDTGVGMSEEVQARLFEPYFTTKGRGKGTGLGLSMVHGIVKQSGGHLWMRSELGKGSTFKIYLPQAPDLAPPVVARTSGETPLHGRETILLTEDDEAVRLLASRVLTASGYTVLEAVPATAALGVARTHGGPIHLLLTDVIMPDLNGRELAAQLRAEHPAMRVLYMSGYTEKVIAYPGAQEDGIGYIQKPFTRERLLARIRETLESPAPAIG